MKTRIKYYKGFLDCQFSTSTPEKIGNTYTQKSTIHLEPRFRLYDPVEIEEQEFISENELETKPYLINKGKYDVEFYFNQSYSNTYNLNQAASEKESNNTPKDNVHSTIEKVDEIILILNNQSATSSTTKEQDIDNYVYHQEGKNAFYANFYANYGKSTHGKIQGQAYLKAIEFID